MNFYFQHSWSCTLNVYLYARHDALKPCYITCVMLCVVDIGPEGLDKAEMEEFCREQFAVLCHKYSLISIFLLI